MHAVRISPDGITVKIEVSPKSDKFKITGYNEWRQTLEVKIKSVPTKGKANKELITEFSKLTNRPVEIISGQKSRMKTIKISSIDEESFLKILKQLNVDFE